MKQWLAINLMALMALSSTLFAELIEVTNASQFQEALRQASSPVFIQFYSTSCFPCRYVHKEIVKWDEELDGKVKVLRIDIRKHTELSRRYEITGVPCLLMVDLEGNPLMTKVGSQEIVDFLASYHPMLEIEEKGAVADKTPEGSLQE